MTTEAKLQEQEHRNNNNITKYRVPVAKKGNRNTLSKEGAAVHYKMRHLRAQIKPTAGFYNTCYPLMILKQAKPEEIMGN